MSFNTMPVSQKKELLNFMKAFDASLRERGFYIESNGLYLHSTDYGYLGILEDQMNSLVLIEDETDYVELLSTLEE